MTRFSHFAFAIVLVGCSPGHREQDLRQPIPESAWSALFARTSGWTGADGAATVSLPGDRTLWLFGDTWIGPVIDGRHAAGSTMVNNTIAVHRRTGLPADEAPSPAGIEFHWTPRAEPGAWATPTQPNEWFWPAGGGIVAPGAGGADRLILFLARIARRDGSDSIWNFAACGASLLIIPNPQDDPAGWRQEQHGLVTLQPGGREVMWGAAVLRAPSSDDLLIYGIDSTNVLNKTLLLARAPAPTIERFDTWIFRTASSLSPNPADAAPIATNVPSELSIHYLPTLARYVMIHSEPPLGARVLARTARAPEGPWSEPIALYTCPEPAADPRRFVYAAKAHPTLSAPGQLLISYCVNSTEFADVAAHADAYRPRFIRVPIASLREPSSPARTP